MTRELSCPSCGFPIPVRSAATLVVGCPQCGVPAYRTGVQLETLGEAAELAQIGTKLSIGARGKFGGTPFGVIGVAQFDHGRGLWNEWHLLFDDQTTAWLAEAQGEFHLSRDASPDGVPDPATLAPGRRLSIAGESFTVAERGKATVVAVRGEVNLALRPGDRFPYADLRGTGGTFASAAQHGPNRVLFVGATVPFASLNIDPTTVQAPPPRRVKGDRFACPVCGAAISMRDPGGACRVVCEACSSILKPDSERLVLLAKQRKLESMPRIALGSTATIGGSEVTVIAYLVRSVTVGGVRYPWSEYLLRLPDGSYRWLVDSRGHWSITSSVNAADVSVVAWSGSSQRALDRGVRVWKGMRHRHFQSGVAVVEHVQGEVYWELKAGERVMTHDYIHVGGDGSVSMLSAEASDGEHVYSRVVYVDPDHVLMWFGNVRARTPIGVAPNQPNPRIQVERQLWAVFGVLAALMLVLALVLRGGEDRTLSQVGLLSGRAAVSDGFSVAEKSDVCVTLSLDTGGAWFSADGMLHESVTGLTVPFVVQANRWEGSGPNDGEGGGRAKARLTGVPPGLWTLRCATEAKNSDGTARGETPASLRVHTSRRDVPFPFGWLLLLLAVPLLGTLASKSFEHARWEDSDHPPGGG